MNTFPTIFHNGREITLLLLAPDLGDSDSLALNYTLATDISAGSTDRESRTPLQDWLRVEQTCSYFLTAKPATELRAALATLDDKLVAVPLWCDIATRATWADRIHETVYAVNLTASTLVASAAIPASTNPEALFAPVLVGKFRERPQLEIITADKAAVTIAVIDDSPPEYRISPASASAPEWPADITPDWTDVIEMSEDGREYQQIGLVREQAVDGQKMPFKWGQEAAVSLTARAEIRSLLGFYYTVRGRHTSFLAPLWFCPGPGTPHAPRETRCRLASDTLSITFSDQFLGATTLGLWQVPWEIVPPAGEIAALPGIAYLYRFSIDYTDTKKFWHFTNWERPLTRAAGEVYSPRPIEHDAITQDYLLDEEAVGITSWKFENHPLLLVASNELEFPLTLEIFECDPAVPDNAQLVYTGNITDVSLNGREITASAQLLSGALGVKVPSLLFSVTCNHRFCGPGCGLKPADWTLHGRVESQTKSVLTVTLDANGTGNDLANDFFARGFIRTGQGANCEIRQIMRSERMTALRQRLTLKTPLRNAMVNTKLTLRPGCPGTCAFCKSVKNFINFGGHPHMGPQNISVPQRASSGSGGKK